MQDNLSEQSRLCWCGSTETKPFSPEYRRCSQCATLVSQHGLTSEQLEVNNDEQDFYGKEYWLSHQTTELGTPSIFVRARTDLYDRCLHWLRTTLKYKLPSAKILELGCAHGGYVALLQEAGFDAQGLELSPWVTEFARQSFGIPVLLGTIESQQLPLHSLDAIVLNDVLEHLPDPITTMARCRELLKPDGVLIVQTPCYPEEASYSDLIARGDRFLEMVHGLAPQHLYLFSRKAARMLFERLGFGTVQFESALFPYDMHFVVGASELKVFDQEQVRESLSHTRQGRVIQALLDQREVVESLQRQLAESEQDRAARLQNMNRLEGWLKDSQARLKSTRDCMAALGKVLCVSTPEPMATQMETVRSDKLGALSPRLVLGLVWLTVKLLHWELNAQKATRLTANKIKGYWSRLLAPAQMLAAKAYFTKATVNAPEPVNLQFYRDGFVTKPRASLVDVSTRVLVGQPE